MPAREPRSALWWGSRQLLYRKVKRSVCPVRPCSNSVSSSLHHCRRVSESFAPNRDGLGKHLSWLPVLPCQKSIERSRKSENKQARRPHRSDGEGASTGWQSRGFRRASSNTLTTDLSNVAHDLEESRGCRGQLTNCSL